MVFKPCTCFLLLLLDECTSIHLSHVFAFTAVSGTKLSNYKPETFLLLYTVMKYFENQ